MDCPVVLSRLNTSQSRRSSRISNRIVSDDVLLSGKMNAPIKASYPPPDEMLQVNEDGEKRDGQALAKRCMRKRKAKVILNEVSDTMEAAMKPLTDEERASWKGWVELESDPAIFNYLLREYGVKDVKVQEVLSLDDEMLGFLPKPVYGFIFLFTYRDEEEEQEQRPTGYPKDVWFANQTINNACATVALLNIVMNVPEIDLGISLERFKADTRRLKPAYKGQKLGSHDFIRSIHNSFVRRMDILNADLALLNEVEKAEKAAKARKSTTKKSAKDRLKKDEEELGYHFIAYVPINGDVWRLDGLQRQPLSLGKYGDDWISVARSNIHHRILQYEEDGVQFNLLSLCQSPLRTIPAKLAEDIHLLRAVEEQLSTLTPNWKEFTQTKNSTLIYDDPSSFGLSQSAIDTVVLSVSSQEQLSSACEDPEKLLAFYHELCEEQVHLQSSYLEEVALIKQEDGQAMRRKHDNTSKIYDSITTLAEQGLWKGILNDVKQGARRKSSS